MVLFPPPSSFYRCTSFPLFRLSPSVCSKALEKVTSLASSPHLLHRHGVGRGNGKKGDFPSRSSGRITKSRTRRRKQSLFPFCFVSRGSPLARHTHQEKKVGVSRVTRAFSLFVQELLSKNLRVVVDESGPQGVEVHGDSHGGAAGANLVRRHLEVWFQ